jgi:hypothetical protein
MRVYIFGAINRTIAVLSSQVREEPGRSKGHVFFVFGRLFLSGMPIEFLLGGADETFQKRHGTNKGGIF